MNKKITDILDIWHKYYSDEKKQYTEFESSDIEYFVGCMLYNHFTFSKALDTMKTIDLSYDFLDSCGDAEYKKIKKMIESLEFENEDKKLEFLQNFITESQSKYTKDECYLLDRLKYHVDSLQDRMQKDLDVQKVIFEKPKPKNPNPLL